MATVKYAQKNIFFPLLLTLPLPNMGCAGLIDMNRLSVMCSTWRVMLHYVVFILFYFFKKKF